MSQRNRRRQRHRGGAGGKLLLVGLGVGALLAIGAVGVVSWVLDVAAKAPSLAACKPIDHGGNSTLYAADGSKLGVIESEEARAPVAIDRIPKSLQHATVAIEDQRFYEHGGVDPEGIVRAALKNLEAGRTVEGGSTITQQLVRNLCITNPQRTLERKIIEAKLAIEYAERHSRREILSQYLNTASYGTIRGATAIGVGAAAQDLLLAAGLEARPRAGGAAGRPAAGADRLQPGAQPARRARAARRGAGEDGQAGMDRAEPGAAGASPRPRARPRPRLLRQAPALLLRLRRGQAARRLRREHGAQGRPARLHDDPPAAAGGGRRSDGVGAPLLGRPRLRPRLDRPAQRRDRGDGDQHRLRRQQVQPRRAGPPPARLDLQDVRADDGAEAGDRPLQHLLRLQAPRPEPAEVGPLGSQHRRPRLPGAGQPAAGDGRLRQHRLRPARPRRRPGGGQGDGEVDGDREPARRDPRRGDRRPAGRRLAAGDGRRLRDPRRRRHPPQPDRGAQGRLPGWEGRATRTSRNRAA